MNQNQHQVIGHTHEGEQVVLADGLSWIEMKKKITTPDKDNGKYKQLTGHFKNEPAKMVNDSPTVPDKK